MDKERSRSREIRVAGMVLGAVATNCYALYREPDEGVNAPAILIDPPDSGEMIFDRLADRGLLIEKIVLTHAHFDHIGGIAGLQKSAEKAGQGHIPVLCPKDEEPLCRDPELNCSDGMGSFSLTIAPDVWLSDGDTIVVGGLSLKVIGTPGHTAGGCCYYNEEAGILFSGDTLFEGSVGRTDLPTGSMSQLIRSIREKLFVLPEDTMVLPGHGGQTTIGQEKKYNPFVG